MVDLVDPSRWPPVSRSVLIFSEFMSNWGLVCAAAVITLLAASIWAAPRWSGSVRQKLDWYPPFALYRKFTGPEILSAWLALMQSGIQRVRALGQLETGLPEYLASHVRTMRSRLYRGDPVETALDTGLFSVETLDDLRIYERIGDFGEHAERIAEEDIARALGKTRIRDENTFLDAAGRNWRYGSVDICRNRPCRIHRPANDLLIFRPMENSS